MPLINFTDAQWRDTKELLRLVKSGRLDNPSRHLTADTTRLGDHHQTTKVYIAQPKTSSGIPARSGTTPGSALCDIYKIAGGELVAIDHDRLVYNLSDNALSQQYLGIKREKFGSWIADSLVDAGPSADQCFDVVTDVICSGGSLTVCTRNICLPADWVGDEDCGGTTPGTGTGTGTGGSGNTIIGCCANPLSNTLTATVTDTTSPATCADGASGSIIWSSGANAWQGTFVLGSCGKDIIVSFYCASSSFSGLRCDIKFSDSCMAPQTLSSPLGQCDPLSATFTFQLPDTCHDGSGDITHTITVTE